MNGAMLFDVETLFILDVAVTAVMACVALFSWFQHREIPSLRGWAIGLAVGSLGALMLCLRRPISPTVELIVGNVLIIAAYATIWASIRRFNDGGSPRRIVVTAGLFAVIFTVAALAGADMHTRIAIASTEIAGLALAASWEVLKGSGRENLRARRPTAIAFSLIAIAMIARVGHALVMSSPDQEIVFYDPTDGLALFVTTVCLVAVTLGFMMMTTERLQLEYESLASTDDLTGLPNRRSFLERGERYIRSTGAPACVLLMDIDHFSNVNRQFGHAGGDRALAAFAAFGRERLRATDLFARYGGEEFCALLPDTDRATATMVAERLCVALAEVPIDVEGRPVRLTASVGVAELESGNLQQSIGKADVALYRAKELGRNRIHCAWDDDKVKPGQSGA
jgi:diguanylate cyclase (GGDEF)-like protein